MDIWPDVVRFRNFLLNDKNIFLLIINRNSGQIIEVITIQ